MAVINVLRPLSVRKAGAGVAVPSGTLASVTSDNSDATYIQFLEVNDTQNWSLRLEPHTPAAGYGRHQLRGRIRIRTDVGQCTEDIDLGRGTSDYLTYKNVSVTDTFTEQVTDWTQLASYGLAEAGPLTDLNIGGGWISFPQGGATEGRTAEAYVDVDCRLRPQYAPQIQDNAGLNKTGGVVTDTTQPVMYFGTADYDGLPALNWVVTVKQGAATVFTSSGAGAPPAEVLVTPGLADGAYTAEFVVRSTIRGADPFEYAQTLSFSVQNTVPPPSPPLVTVTPEFGGYRVEWTDPGGQAWDNGYVVAELWRDDCTGSQRIATIPDGLNGSYLDLAIPQLDPQATAGVDCEVSSEPCDLTYRVRYLGYISTYVQLPSTIPSQMILGWPSTAASIPSGWSRVTALDGYYPRGASTTAAPTATGGTASHSHTTPGHTHPIGSHSHSVDGNTGSSNSSTTSARFNGASQPQADQPHTHARPDGTGSHGGGTSGSAAPGTSTANNLPATREVIWIKSDGAQANYPVGVLGWATENVSGWTPDASSAGRFLKGAAAAGNGGASSGGATHAHTVNGHTHSGLTHDHSIGNTGLSNPSSGTEAGYGSSSPRWLPRHTHPMDVISTGTGSTTATAGGTSGGSTNSVNLEPPNRRLQVLRNTGGGTQTRIIGLYTGTVAGLDPLLSLCNGANGTPDMRTWFARDKGSDSINSTGGSSSHSHTTPTHQHDIAGHVHDTNVGTSNTGSFERPSFGDLGDSPTTSHTHSSGNTGNGSPPVTGRGAGNTNSVSHLPTYKEAHFVRLDGTISGGPLPVPELRISEFASATVPAFSHGDDMDRLSSFTDRIAVVTDRSHVYPRLVADALPLDGGLPSVSVTLAGEDMSLTIAAEGLPAINRLETMLRNERVYWSPVGGTPGWYAPMGWSVRAPAPTIKVVSVTMVRQPWPDTIDPEVYL
jgi:hypothetical protein